MTRLAHLFGFLTLLAAAVYSLALCGFVATHLPPDAHTLGIQVALCCGTFGLIAFILSLQHMTRFLD